MSEHSDFIQAVIEAEKPLYRAYTKALWEAATTGTREANLLQRQTQAAHMRFWADSERYATAKRLHESGVAEDRLTARLLKVIYLSAAKAQQDDETIERITRLEAEVRQEYYNFRAEIDGQRLNDNEIDEILAKCQGSAEARAAWEASKQVGARVDRQVRQLARLRNAAARAQGFRDHFARSLTLNEIRERELMALFSKLERVTREPYARLKARIDQRRSSHFGVDGDDLRPWHYGDRFFQKAPDLDEVDLDGLFSSKDPVLLATATYDSLGLEVRDILERSDLYGRDGKNQHAFCLDLDREGDVRTLNNLQPNHRWNETLLHELGHAVYDKYIDRSIPWILRKPPHLLSTEAVALLMGSLTYSKDWLTQIADAPEAEATQLAQSAERKERAHKLVFSRWAMVMSHFERAFYADPDRDLNDLWWDLVEKFQQLRRPDARDEPDWAAKYHIPLAPVYYHNYLLGMLAMEQLVDRLDGERVFRSGASQDWATQLKEATGEALNSRYFVQALG